MSEEAANVRMARIRETVANDWIVPLEDVQFLLERLGNAERMLHAQQSAVEDAARRWREIGYDDGFDAGYQRASDLLNVEMNDE